MGYLTINGNNLDSRVLINSVNVTIGRQSITEQPIPGTFTCQFYLEQSASLAYPIEIGNKCTYAIKNPSAASGQTQVFSGTISDISISLQWGSGKGLYLYTIYAVDGLADLPKYQIGISGYAKTYEGTRITNILNEAATLYGYTISTAEIDLPGDYEIAVYNGGQTDAYSLIQEAANSAMGTFYWDQLNSCYRYCTYTARKTRTPITIAASNLIAADFNLSVTSNEVCNVTQLSYGTGALGTQYSDYDSVIKYGPRAGVRNTTLHNSSDANSIAQILLAARKDPDYNLTSITLNSAILSNSLRNSLAKVEVGSIVYVTGLPTKELHDFTGFVESYTWTADRGQDIIQMTLSSTTQQYTYTLWNQLNSTDTWQTYATATTTWGDLT